ncbi:fibronectin type III domain-containing protein [Paenibacillus macerans]|uniref:Fibronectin type III domain protein n=1 Tax=Paenibacillus macerans TaxID=44252 RepID=A0A090YL53_PAEMA|nr:fibronectin type III domain-containing protein [Paenibacillus macerans]KFM92910.1 fibronectin type III domain protein [Paenibacillus macerans]MCY7558547.1 fibronectin type III domain-containing protein [Paenibacillus macerans]MEC0153945.1 fibronectin type III domain-containing protein [Paenibacillus macerans]SUA84783.1 fibronectin [Paenibacillus macerans]
MSGFKNKVTSLVLSVALVLSAFNFGVGTSEAAAHAFIYKKYETLAEPYGPWIDSSGINGDIEDAMSNGLITYTGWSNFTFDASTGRYSLNGSSKTFTVGDHGPSPISESFAYISEYKIYVGREITFSPPENTLWVYRDYKWDREGTRLSTGIIYNSFSAQPSGYTYSRGAFIGDVQAPDGTYPNNGRHSDGYWYVKGEVINTSPTLTVTTTGDKYISEVSGYNSLTISGTANDPDGDTLTISGSLGGVSKSTTVTPEGSWSLSWTADAIPQGNYPLTVSVADGFGGSNSASYSGTIFVDKTPPTKPTIILSTSDWSGGKITATITAGTDTGSGVSKTEFRVGEGDWTTYNGVVEISTEGQTELYARTVDKAGNVSEEASVMAKVDLTAPTITISPKDVMGWTDKPVGIVVKYGDNLSGLSSNGRKYKVTTSPEDPASWNTADSDELRLTLAEEGKWYVHAQAVDQAGNKVTVTSSPYQIQFQPEVAEFQSRSVGPDWAEIRWLLPNTPYTDGYKYVIENTITGKTWLLDYPENKIKEEGLTAGSTYKYRIKVLNHVGETDWSEQFEVLTLPAAVDNLRVSFVTNNSKTVNVSFDEVSSADSYILLVKDADRNVYEEELSAAGTYQVTGLEPGKQYTVSVTAKNASGSGESSILGFLSLPAAPGEFQSAQIRETEVELTWSASETASLYELLRDAINRYSGPYLSSYTDTGLDSGTEYDYQLAAKNESGFGDIAYLNGVLTLPGKTEIAIEEVGKNEVTLSIKNAVRGAENYMLLVNGVEERELSAETKQFTVTSLEPGSRYTFEVYAKNRSGTGAAGRVSVSTLPDMPQGINVSEVGETQAKLSWDPVTGADKYKVSVTDTVYYEISGTEMVLADLSAGTLYQPKVVAGNASGYGEATTGTFLTLPAMPGNVHLKEVKSNQMTFAWDEVTSANKYVIYNNNGEQIGDTANTSYSVGGLKPGETITVNVSAVNDTGEGPKSSFSQRTLPADFDVDPNDPNGPPITIGDRGEHSVVIIIEPVDGAGWYKVIDGDGNVVGIITTPETAKEIEGLESAKEYDDWKIIPVNDAGEGKAAPVPLFVTLPSSNFEVSVIDPTQKTLTVKIDSSLSNEVFVYASGGKVLYRGKDKVITVSNLVANHPYTFDVWTENSIGEKTEPKTASGRTLSSSLPSGSGGSGGTNHGGSDLVTPDQPPVHEPSLPENEEPKSVDNKLGFSDIDRSFAKNEILALYDQGIVKGVADTKFEPDREVTRVEFASMMVRALELQAASDVPLTFEDIQRTAWYAPELGAAVLNGVARGFSDKEFRPYDPINREQAAKMIANAAYKGMLPAAGIRFKDADMIAFWAKPEVAALTSEQVINGYPDETFKPKRKLTRAECAALIYRTLGLME